MDKHFCTSILNPSEKCTSPYRVTYIVVIVTFVSRWCQSFIRVQHGAPLVTSYFPLPSRYGRIHNRRQDEKVLPTVSSPEIKQAMTESKSDEPIRDYARKAGISLMLTAEYVT